MIHYAKPHVSFTYVLNFLERDKQVRLNQALAESAFGSLISTQSQQTNLADDDDPSQPRLFFQTDKKNIAISQIACQLSLNFQGSGVPFVDQIAIAKKNIELFCQRASLFKEGFGFSGLILDLQYPSESNLEEIANFLHQRFIKHDQIGSAASTVFQLGYRVNDVYLNLSVNAYESRKYPEVVGKPVYIAVETLPITERGLQIRIDSNNRLDLQRAATTGVVLALMETIEEFLEHRFAPLFDLPLP